MEKDDKYLGVHVLELKKLPHEDVVQAHGLLDKFLEGVANDERGGCIQNNKLGNSLNSSKEEEKRTERESYEVIQGLSGELRRIADLVLSHGFSCVDAESVVKLEQYYFNNLEKYFPELCSKHGIGGAYVALKLEGHTIFRAEDYSYAKELLSKGEVPHKVLKIVRGRSKNWKPSHSFPENDLFS